jgi:glycosyltransferase involved in cell wall biosynthesis
MTTPLFSIVVPTRNRADTLLHTLLTCLNQASVSLEIVVADNSDDDETSRLVRELADPKIRYAKPPQVLSMAANWEFALEQATGEYIAFLGDDDALLPGSLEALSGMLAELRCSALRWDRAVYAWPGYDAGFLPNSLRLPLSHTGSILRRDLIPKVANNVAEYGLLPNPYPGIIHRSLFEEAKKRLGHVFAGSSPDIYSGYVLAYLARTWVSIGYPFSIVGLSAKSNGAALVHSRSKKVAADFRRLNAVAGLVCHPQAPDIASLSAALADMFLWARERLFPNERSYRLDRRMLCRHSVREIPGGTEEDWHRDFEAVRRSVADDQRLSRWFAQAFRETRPTPMVHRTAPLGVYQGCLTLDAGLFGASNVLDAAELARKVLGPPPSVRDLFSDGGALSPYRRARAAVRILLRGR